MTVPNPTAAEAAQGLVADGLACRRGGRLVFHGLSFQLRPGGALLVTGPNGSGKSSLLRLVAGFLQPHAGSLSWDGVPVPECTEAYRRSLAYVGHLDAVKPTLSAFENLAFWSRVMMGVSADDQVDVALAAFGLTDLADLPGRYLSAGQRRRLALARLLIGESRLWLLDEPTLALDGESVRLLEEVMAQHREGGGLIAIATHTTLCIDTPTLVELSEFSELHAGESWL